MFSLVIIWFFIEEQGSLASPSQISWEQFPLEFVSFHAEKILVLKHITSDHLSMLWPRGEIGAAPLLSVNYRHGSMFCVYNWQKLQQFGSKQSFCRVSELDINKRSTKRDNELKPVGSDVDHHFLVLICFGEITVFKPQKTKKTKDENELLTKASRCKSI